MHHLALTVRRLSLCGVVVIACGLLGCGESHPNEKQAYKVKGTVTVDGKPTADIQIAFHDVVGPDNKQPTYPQGFTDAEGHLRVSTYADGDGAPAGEYKVTFAWQEYNLMARSFSGPDKLKNRYSDPKTTPITLKVGPDQTNDLGNVELTTK